MGGLLLGYDLGSSAIKAALVDLESGRQVAAATSPDTELAIAAPRPGWAEQDPEVWWQHLVAATTQLGDELRGTAGRWPTSRQSESPTRCTAWC